MTSETAVPQHFFNSKNLKNWPKVSAFWVNNVITFVVVVVVVVAAAAAAVPLLCFDAV